MKDRKLTPNEVGLARKVFRDSVDYNRVAIHAHSYIFFQAPNSGMTPNGEIYVDGKSSTDYGLAPPGEQAFFVHEMVHVWQKQNDILNPIWSAIGNMLRHGFVYSRAYNYTLDKASDLLDYRIEQQAQIIEDYFRITHTSLKPRPGHLQNKETGLALSALFSQVLAKFLADPSYAANP